MGDPCENGSTLNTIVVLRLMGMLAVHHFEKWMYHTNCAWLNDMRHAPYLGVNEPDALAGIHNRLSSFPGNGCRTHLCTQCTPRH